MVAWTQASPPVRPNNSPLAIMQNVVASGCEAADAMPGMGVTADQWEGSDAVWVHL